MTTESQPNPSDLPDQSDDTAGAPTDSSARAHGFSRRGLIASAAAAGGAGVVGAVAGFGAGR
ncbi:MAG: peroxidase, partial [Brevibacterium sp.]|nr:peroxidase [Brevibacterium sp.]